MFRRLADGIFAIAGSAGMSQFPEFYQQYAQRLGGRLDQALIQEGRIVEAAARHQMTPDEYADYLATNPDPVVQTEGGVVQANLADVEKLEAAYVALTTSDALDRPFVFAQIFDPDIATATLNQFVPAVPISLEALIYAGLGMVIGLILLAGGEKTAKATGRAVTRRRRRQRV